MLTASQARLIAPLSENHYNLYKYVLPAITQRAYDGWSWCEIDFTNIPHTDMASLLSSLEHNEYHTHLVSDRPIGKAPHRTEGWGEPFTSEPLNRTEDWPKEPHPGVYLILYISWVETPPSPIQYMSHFTR
jgi:hypothetical protein